MNFLNIKTDEEVKQLAQLTSEIWHEYWPVILSDEQIDLPENSMIETDEVAENTPQNGRKRHTLGSLPTITAIFGLTIANQVIKKLSQEK